MSAYADEIERIKWEQRAEDFAAEERMRKHAPELLSALVSLEQAYSNRHSPQHRAAALAEAKTVIAKATGAQ